MHLSCMGCSCSVVCSMILYRRIIKCFAFQSSILLAGGQDAHCRIYVSNVPFQWIVCFAFPDLRQVSRVAGDAQGELTAGWLSAIRQAIPELPTSTRHLRGKGVHERRTLVQCDIVSHGIHLLFILDNAMCCCLLYRTVVPQETTPYGSVVHEGIAQLCHCLFYRITVPCDIVSYCITFCCWMTRYARLLYRTITDCHYMLYVAVFLTTRYMLQLALSCDCTVLP